MFRRLLPIALGAALPWAGGCGAADVSPSAASDRGNTYTDDTETDTAPYVTEVPAGYALSGVLSLDPADDLLDVQITTYDVLGEELCTEPLLVQLTEAQPPADEPVLLWWDVTLDVSTSLCDVPPGLWSAFGVGAWDDRLEVPLAQQGLDAATAHSLYLQADEQEPVWVVGVVGTEAQLSGDELADPYVAPPDGIYQLSTLVQVPWPE